MKWDKFKIIVLVFITIFVVVYNQFFKKEAIEKEKISIVISYNDFFTVNSCLKRFGGYLSSKNINNVYLVTSDNYKNKNKITKNNILEEYPNFNDSNYEIFSKKMYYSKLKNGIKKYYAEVEYKNSYDNSYIAEGYFIVYLDNKNGLFSIEPYDGKIFKEGVENE